MAVLFFALSAFSVAAETTNKIHPALNHHTAGLVPVIIEYEHSVSPEKKQLRELGCVPGKVLKALHGISAECPAEILETLAEDNELVYVWADELVPALLSSSVQLINATVSWADFGNGSGINVSIIDSGINTSQGLAGQVVLEQDFTTLYSSEGLGDYCNHGTPVACVVGCINDTYRGVAPGAKLFNAKAGFVSDTGQCVASTSGIISAIDWSVEHGAQVIQISFGSGGTCYEDALDIAVNNTGKNIPIVIGAGNGGPSNLSIAAPACAENAIAVGASNGDAVADYSSRGPTDYGLAKPDLVAPGTVITANNDGTFGSHTGTSFSSPHVAGVVALMLEQNRFLFPWLVKEILKNNSIDLGYDENTQGAGRVDAWAAVNIAQGVVVPPLLTITPAVPSGNAVAQSFVINATIKNNGGESAENATAVLSVPEGLSILDSAERAIGSIGPGSSAFVNWTLNASHSGNYSANITASAAGIDDAFSPFMISIDPTTFGLELQPDSSAGTDAYISSAKPNTNYGSNSVMQVQTDTLRALVEWNLSQVPAEADVVNAVARFYVPSVKKNDDVTVSAYRLTQSWTESSVTWNKYDGVNNWATAGGDYNSTVWASETVSAPGQFYTWNITSLVASWRNGTYANYGVIMISQAAVRKDLSSSDASNASRRPALEINYTL